MIAGARSEVMLPRINSIILALRDLSHLHASQAMMARKFILIFTLQPQFCFITDE
jgi:hypothetical protein